MAFCGDIAGAVTAELEPSPGKSLIVCFVCHWLIIELRESVAVVHALTRNSLPPATVC